MTAKYRFLAMLVALQLTLYTIRSVGCRLELASLPGLQACFLSDPGVPGVRAMGPDGRPSVTADLTDVTLADEDSNSIPTDDVNSAI